MAGVRVLSSMMLQLMSTEVENDFLTKENQMKINIVENEDKPAFPGKYFKDHLFDLKVFHIADHLMKGYSGGNWDYCLTDTGVAFMNLSGDQVLRNPFSGVEVEVPGFLSGMIVTSYAMARDMERGVDFYAQHDALNRAISELCQELDRSDIWFDLMD